MLIAFGGLPGTGKTTLARTVAARYAAVYLRIDTIEQAIRSSDVLRKILELLATSRRIGSPQTIYG
jgi:predicted kinase